ncbi:tRNA (adenosine(37)-N6)-dimethylallyltransferase MiaA [Candidatus Peribacteria bacterium]|nr:MAG: tRNA (adenosine(37)-N6)-dimethylallyltransferase MiaA [Candidatus Peribacteria bacterium]
MEILRSDQWQDLVTDLLGGSIQPLIVVLGPTASGKTKFSVDVAHFIREKQPTGWMDAEIINADSRQLYTHMNIGTAKITEEEKRGVVHHLFDVLDPTEDVSIAWYKEKATDLIDDCHRRRVVPILVGGSMLYISAVVDGLDPLPPVDPELRAKLEKEWDIDDGWSLYDRLLSLDPVTAKNFQAQNKRYVVRALELYEKTGVIPSLLKKTIPPPYQILQLGMYWPRDILTERIDKRTELMLDAGWIEEVEGLLDRGYTSKDFGMKSHGYREIIAWLQHDEQDKGELVELIASKTRQYAKRQMTWWWGDDERIKWIDMRQQV